MATTSQWQLHSCSSSGHSSRWKWAVGQCLCEFRSQNSAQHFSYSTFLQDLWDTVGHVATVTKTLCCPWSWKNNSTTYNKIYSLLPPFHASSCSLGVIKAKSKCTKPYYNLYFLLFCNMSIYECTSLLYTCVVIWPITLCNTVSHIHVFYWFFYHSSKHT